MSDAGLHLRVDDSDVVKSTASLDALGMEAKRTEKATDSMSESFKRNSKNSKSMKKGTDEASESMKRVRNIAQQAGYQLQDSAVQLQAGTNGFIVLGQQGSQFATAFGPGGAVFGAALAIGSAIAGAAFSAFQTAKEMDALREEALDLYDAFNLSEKGALVYNERLERLAETAPEVARALFDIKQQQLELEKVLTFKTIIREMEDFRAISSKINETDLKGADIRRLARRDLSELIDEYKASAPEIIKVGDALRAFNKESSQATGEELINSLSALQNGSEEATEKVGNVVALIAKYVEITTLASKTTDNPFDKHNKSLDSLVKNLQLEAATLNKSKRERDLYTVSLLESTEQQKQAIKQINEAYDLIEGNEDSKRLERLKRTLMSETEAIEASYEERQALILRLTEEGSDEQTRLLLQLAQRRKEALDRLQAPEVKKTDSRRKEFDRLVASLQTEEEAVRSSYRRRIELIEEFTVEGSAREAELKTRALNELNKGLAKADESYWQRYLRTMEEQFTNMNGLAMNTIDTFSSGMGRAFEDILFESQTAEEAFKTLMESMVRSTVNALGRMAAEWLAYQAVQLLINKSTQVAGGVALISEAQAASNLAAIHAFSSTAAIPIVGPALAPGAAGAALAATQTLAGAVTAAVTAGFAGGFDRGGYIPAGKFGIVGELGPEIATGPMRITGRKKTEDLLAAGGKQQGETVSVTNVMQISTGVEATTRAEVMRMMPQIAELTKRNVMSAMKQGGEMSRLVGKRR